jgi:uncharacterized protein YdgA (DUF945 family)
MRTVKRIFIFLLLLIFLLALLPFAEGIIFKRAYLSLIDINTHGKAQVQEYNLGWLSSTAKIYIPFGGTDAKSNLPAGVTLDETIYHGPYLIDPSTNVRVFKQAAIVTTVHLDPKLESYLLGNNTSDGIMQMTTLISHQNHFTTQVQTPVFNIKVGSEGKIVVQSTSGTVESDAENNFIKSSTSDWHLGAISGESNGISVSATPATLQASVNCENTASLCSVRANASFPLLQGTNAQGGTAKLTGLHFKTDSHNVDNNYSNDIQFSVSSLVTPDYSTGASSLKLSYSHLNAAEIRDLLSSLQQAQEQYTDMRSNQLAAAAALNAALPKIITQQTTFNEALKISTASGALTSTGKLFWPPNTSAASSAELMMAADAQVNVRASVALVASVIKEMDDKKAAEEEAAAAAEPKPVVEAPPPFITIDETKLPAYIQFRQEINALVANKVITPQIQIVIYKMSDSHTPVRDFNNAVDAILKSNQITYPVATNLRNGYLSFFDAQQKAILEVVFATPATNLRDLKAKIQSLDQAKVISDNVANELIDLQQQSLAPEIYNVALGKLVSGNVIPAELNTLLKSQYDVINRDLSLNPETALNAPVAAAPAPPVGDIQAEFNSYLQQGYIKQDLNEYVIDFEYKNGVITLNGVPLKNSK